MRYILIRELLELQPERAVARTTFSPDDEYLLDHFPGFPMVPGALLTEAMAQTGGWLIVHRLDFGAWPLLTMIEKAKFRSIVRPGVELTLTAVLESAARQQFRIKATAEVDRRRVADARLFFQVFEPETAGWLPDGIDKWSRETLARLLDNSSSRRQP